MKQLSEYRGEQAIDILAELIEPATAIMADKEVAELARSKAPAVKIIKPAIKNHKREVIEILAVLEGEEPEKYAKKVTILTFM